MFTEFRYWWKEQAGFLLAPLLAALDSSVMLVAEFDAAGRAATLELRRRRYGREVPLGRFPSSREGLGLLAAAAGRWDPGVPVILRLPGSAFLEKRLSLPRAALPYLDQTLAAEIEQETPYLAEEVHWAAFPEHAAPGLAEVTVRLVLIRRQEVSGLLQNLEAAGLPATGLDGFAAVEGRGRATIPLPRPVEETRRVVLRARRAAVACAALFGFAVATPFLRQSLQLFVTDRRIAAAMPAFQAADALRQRLGVEAASRAAAGPAAPLVLLARLTDLLPDDTQLTGLTLSKRDATVSGLAADATALLPRFVEAGFADAKFAAPVVREGARDSFAIRFSAEPAR
jgi:general secretion pathway protein L